jgi:diguanylate cyclase (GGDEF)-like protein/PAS domain S-box-containing protein
MSNDDPTDPRPITEARLLSMVNASGDSFWETDVERRFVHVSDNMCLLMGYAREHLPGRPVFQFMTPEYRAQVLLHTDRRGSGGNPLANVAPIRHEGEFFRADGSRLWIETVSVPVFDDDGLHIGYFGITRDANERKRAEQALVEANHQLELQLRHIQALHAQMREQAIRDDLTGVHNRRHFGEVAAVEIAEALRQGASLSLVMMDIDHFKDVNDAHGHPTGDVALKAVGTMLSATKRVGDLACRLGGEEFAVLLVGMSHEAAMERAESWRAMLAEMAVQADGTTLRLTASFGVATFPEQATNLVELMKVADARLYRAKSLGRDRVTGKGNE